MEDYKIKEKLVNEKLNDMMATIRKDNGEDRMIELLKEAAASKFIVPLRKGTDGQLSLEAVHNSDNKQYMVVYSDSESFEADHPLETERFGVLSPFEDLVAAVTGNASLEGFVINPGAEEVLFGKEMLALIAEQMNVGKNSVKIGQPDHFPEQLLKMIEEFAKDESSLSKVYVRLMQINGGTEYKWLMILDDELSGEARDYMHENFKKFISSYTDGMDVVVMSVTDDTMDKVISNVTPFWKR